MGAIIHLFTLSSVRGSPSCLAAATWERSPTSGGTFGNAMLSGFLPLNVMQMAVLGVIKHTLVLLWRTQHVEWKHFVTLM